MFRLTCAEEALDRASRGVRCYPPLAEETRELVMIIREWRGRAAPSNGAAYPAHFRSNVLPELRALPGFRGAHLSQRPLGEAIEFLVLTRWQSLDAIRRFAGSDITRAVVEPAAVAALLDFDARVAHYELIEEELEKSAP